MINSLIVKYKEYGLVKDVHYFYNLDDENSLSKASWSKSEDIRIILKIIIFI